MPYNQSKPRILQTVIVIQDVSVKELEGGKTVYNFTTDDGSKFQCWDKGIADYLSDCSEVEIKYYEKQNGKYHNMYITAYKNTDGQWVEQEKKAFTPKAHAGAGPSVPAADPIQLTKGYCLGAASRVVAGYATNDKGVNLTLLGAQTIKLAREFEAYFKAEKPTQAELPKPKEVEAAA